VGLAPKHKSDSAARPADLSSIRWPRGPQSLAIVALDLQNEVHLKAILRKLEAHNRTQAAIWAIEHGLRNDFPEHSGLVANAPNGRERDAAA
jgi:hypothetical protein